MTIVSQPMLCGFHGVRARTCCFSGHRNIPISEREMVAKRLEKEIISLISDGYCYFEAGGALGFDTVCAETVLSLRKHYPSIRLTLVLPCVSQADRWSPADVAAYRRIIAQADEVVYTSQKYTKGCMFRRNRYMVEHSSVCVCWLRRDTGGTAYTVNYAKKMGLRVINVAFEQHVS